MEVYTALFDSTGKALTDTLPLVLDKDSFSQELQHRNILFVGDGAEKCRPFLSHPNAHFTQEVIHPLAAHMLRPALLRIEASAYEDVAYWEPFYLKEFMATVAKNKVIPTTETL